MYIQTMMLLVYKHVYCIVTVSEMVCL